MHLVLVVEVVVLLRLGCVRLLLLLLLCLLFLLFLLFLFLLLLLLFLLKLVLKLVLNEALLLQLQVNHTLHLCRKFCRRNARVVHTDWRGRRRGRRCCRRTPGTPQHV